VGKTRTLKGAGCGTYVFYFEPKGARLGRRPLHGCLLYTSPSPRDLSTSRMPSSA